MGMNPEDFDLAAWLHEHHFSEVPVPTSLFITPVTDAASGGEFLVIGFMLNIETAAGVEPLTQCIALDNAFTGILAANLEKHLPDGMMDAARQAVATRDAEIATQIVAAQKRHPSDAANWDPENEDCGGELNIELPQIPMSPEVIEQMIKDDRDKNKDGF